MKQLLLILLALTTLGVNAQSFNIPDQNFRTYLLTNLAINSDGDDEITTTEAAAFNGTIDCSNRNINDLTGIAYFTALTVLHCYGNNLSSLDLSQNTALTELNCSGNNLSSLDFNQNLALTKLLCSNNTLSSLDLSQNTSLNFLYCFNNQLTSLNVANGNNTNIDVTSFDARNNPNLSCIQVDNVAYSNLTWVIRDASAAFSTDCGPFVNIPDANFKASLVGSPSINTNGDGEISFAEAAAFTGSIDCNGQNISSLEGIEAFTALTELYCHQNNLMSLDLSQNTALTLLRCNNNPLNGLDLSQNIALSKVYCYSNTLVSLDVSRNTALTEFYCSNNQLTSLNIANGNNMNINSQSFSSYNNPNLSCIQVDDVAYSNANWSYWKDAAASFSTNCSLGIDDFGTEVSVSVYPNPATSQLGISSKMVIASITLVDITGKEIARPELNNNSIDISYLNKGLYFLQIETPSGSVVEKFVKN